MYLKTTPWFSDVKTEKRPGRDLNPGQKIRNLLGCPLPHRDRRLITALLKRLSSLKYLTLFFLKKSFFYEGIIGLIS
jgi:hypothetical protein